MQARQHMPKGGVLSKASARLCQNPDFQEWLNAQQMLDLTVAIECEQDAAAVIRLVCGIESRAELDHNPNAERIFHDKFRRPFTERVR